MIRVRCFYTDFVVFTLFFFLHFGLLHFRGSYHHRRGGITIDGR